MKAIIRQAGTGKTRELLEYMKDYDGYIVCLCATGREAMDLFNLSSGLRRDQFRTMIDLEDREYDSPPNINFVIDDLDEFLYGLLGAPVRCFTMNATKGQ